MVVTCGQGWCFVVYLIVCLHVASQSKDWGTYAVACRAWNASSQDSTRQYLPGWQLKQLCICSHVQLQGNSDSPPQIGAYLSYQGFPVRFVWGRRLNLFSLNFCPLDIELQVVFVPLLGVTFLVTARCQLSIEQLSWYPSFIYVIDMAEPVKLSLDYLSFNAYRASSTENFLIPTRESIWLTEGSMCETPPAAWYVSGTGSMFHSCIGVKEGLMFYKLSSLIDRWMSLCCKTFAQNLPSAQLAFWIWAATSLSRDPLMYIVLSSYVKESMFFQLCAINGDAWLSKDTVWSRLEEDFCLPEADHQTKHLQCFSKSVDDCFEVVFLMDHQVAVISKRYFSNKSLQCLFLL